MPKEGKCRAKNKPYKKGVNVSNSNEKKEEIILDRASESTEDRNEEHSDEFFANNIIALNSLTIYNQTQEKYQINSEKNDSEEAKKYELHSDELFDNTSFVLNSDKIYNRTQVEKIMKINNEITDPLNNIDKEGAEKEVFPSDELINNANFALSPHKIYTKTQADKKGKIITEITDPLKNNNKEVAEKDEFHSDASFYDTSFALNYHKIYNTMQSEETEKTDRAKTDPLNNDKAVEGNDEFHSVELFDNTSFALNSYMIYTKSQAIEIKKTNNELTEQLNKFDAEVAEKDEEITSLQKELKDYTRQWIEGAYKCRHGLLEKKKQARKQKVVMDHFAILEIKYDYTVAKHDSIKCQQNEYLAFEQKRIEDFTEMIANQRKLQEDAIASNTYLVQNHSERVAALKKQSENLQVDGKNLVATVQSKKQAYDQKLTECAKLNKESEVQLQNELKNIDMTFAEYRERSKLKIIEGAGLISKLNDNLKEKTLNYQSLKDNHQSLVAQLDKSSQNNALEIEKFEKKLNEFNTLIATNKESYEKELQNIRDLSMQMALQRKNEIAVWQEKKMENTRQIHQISQQLEKLEEKKGKLVDLPTKENEYIRQLKARKELQMLRICDIQEQLQKMDEIIDDLSQNQHHMKINVVKPISYLRETTAILGQLNGQQVESVSTRTDTIQALPEAVITDHPRNSEVIAVDKDSVDLETDSEGETPSPKLPPIDMPSQEEDVKPFNKPAERAIVTDVKIICRGSSLRESAPIISPPSKQQLESASVSADTANVKFNVVYKDFIDLDSESDVGTSSPKLSQQQKDVNQFDNPTEHAVVTTVDKICESSLGKTEATISASIEQQVQSASADTIEDVPYVASPNHPQKTKRGGTFDDYSEFENESDFDIPPLQFRPLKRRRRHAIQNLSLYS